MQYNALTRSQVTQTHSTIVVHEETETRDNETRALKLWQNTMHRDCDAMETT